MSITLFYLVKGNTIANAQTKVEGGNCWRTRRSVEESHTQGQRRAPCHKKIFEILPSEECLHVIVEPLVLTATSSREQELLDQIARRWRSHLTSLSMSETKVELEARLKAIPINESDAPKSQYVCSYLVVGANLYELRPAKYRRTQWTWIGRFHNRLAQTAKRCGKVYFMECSLDDQDRQRFKLLRPVSVVYDSENMGGNKREIKRITVLEAGNIEIKAENTRLRAELKAKIEELESRVDVTTENAKLKELRSWNRISVNHKLKWLTMKLSPLLPSCDLIREITIGVRCNDVSPNRDPPKAHVYKKAYNAEDDTIKANQTDFIIGFDKSIDEIMVRDRVSMKKAKG
ncbi:hypothetical protein GLOIN_2v1789859 [Rhizophagus irregularis DAOM 181602=DAOM 197198]|nr:hypothetical protein GLOIN_2v1789859 [Rhizophagus irregularis DAOM 181602=DAOM 197198]